MLAIPTVTLLNNLAGLHESQGRDSKAEPLYLRFLQICEQRLGVDHPTTARVRKNYHLFLAEWRSRSRNNADIPCFNCSQSRANATPARSIAEPNRSNVDSYIKIVYLFSSKTKKLWTNNPCSTKSNKPYKPSNPKLKSCSMDPVRGAMSNPTPTGIS